MATPGPSHPPVRAISICLPLMASMLACDIVAPGNLNVRVTNDTDATILYIATVTTPGIADLNPRVPVAAFADQVLEPGESRILEVTRFDGERNLQLVIYEVIGDSAHYPRLLRFSRAELRNLRFRITISALGHGADGAIGVMATDPLLTITPVALADEIRSQVQRFTEMPWVARVSVAELNPDAPQLLTSGRQLSIDLEPQHPLIVIIGDVVARGAMDVSARGAGVSDPAFSANFVLTSRGLTAAIRSPSATFLVQPLHGSQALHAVIRVLPDQFPQEQEPISGDAVHDDVEEGYPRAPDAGPMSTPNPGPIHDVLVVYTPTVAAWVTDVPGLIQLAIDETNQSYSNSAIDLNVRLASYAQVSYNEISASTYEDHLFRLQNPTDGYMDEVHAWRDQHLADLVVLLVNDDQYCGFGYVLSNESTAFSVVTWYCATGNYSFGHEIGHNQGAHHDIQTHQNPFFAHGHGYIAPNNAWRTIMSYPTPCNGCPRVQFWSNPDVTYPGDGQLMGTTSTEDNARVLMTTRYTIRDFRTLPAPQDVTLDNRTSIGANPQMSWDPTPNADVHHVYRCLSADGNLHPWCYEWISQGHDSFTDLSVSITQSDRQGKCQSFPAGVKLPRATHDSSPSPRLTRGEGRREVAAPCTPMPIPAAATCRAPRRALAGDGGDGKPLEKAIRGFPAPGRLVRLGLRLTAP